MKRCSRKYQQMKGEEGWLAMEQEKMNVSAPVLVTMMDKLVDTLLRASVETLENKGVDGNHANLFTQPYPNYRMRNDTKEYDEVRCLELLNEK